MFRDSFGSWLCTPLRPKTGQNSRNRRRTPSLPAPLLNESSLSFPNSFQFSARGVHALSFGLPNTNEPNEPAQETAEPVGFIKISSNSGVILRLCAGLANKPT